MPRNGRLAKHITGMVITMALLLIPSLILLTSGRLVKHTIGMVITMARMVTTSPLPPNSQVIIFDGNGHCDRVTAEKCSVEQAYVSMVTLSV